MVCVFEPPEPAQQDIQRPEDTAIVVEPSPAQLLSPPVFLAPLQDTSAVDGQELHMTCHVSGTPMPTVSFFHDSRNIDEDEEFVVSYNPDTGEVCCGETCCCSVVVFVDCNTLECMLLRKLT